VALTIEDGTGVAGANSYISVVDAQAYATARGISVTVTEALLLKAMDYIEALRGEFQGTKVEGTNALQWPREGAQLDGYDIDDDEIPDILPQAQAQLACDAYTYTLLPVSDGREVVAESVAGAVSVQYAQSGDTAPQPHFAAARALLDPLLKSAVGGGPLSSLRV
jgi:hypothetical protein